MKNLKTSILILVAFLSLEGFAQAPNWSVNFRAFQYSMSVTAVLEINCTELDSSANQIGAFVGDTLRGTANTVEDSGRYYSLFLVYSNVASGEVVTFRYYDVNSDSIYAALDTLTFQDNASIGDFTTPLVVANNDAPDSILISNTMVIENDPLGTVVANLSTRDFGANQTHTYTLAAGSGDADNTNFSIVGNQLRILTPLDYEAKSSLSIRIRTDDNSGCTYEQAFALSVQNVNEAPIDLLLSANAIDENVVGTRFIGKLSAVDPDLNETFTFGLVASAPALYDNADFTLVGDSLYATSTFNYEVKDTLKVLAEVFDLLNNRLEKELVILVNDRNDFPTALTLDSNAVFENEPLNTLIGTFSTIDEDVSQTPFYSFAGITGNNNALFSIIGNQLFTSAVFDFETRTQYLVYVITNDQNGGSFTNSFVITVNDANDAPTNLLVSNLSINEGLPIGSYIGSLQTIDADTGQTFSYSLTSGTGSVDNANFSVANDSLFTAVVLDSAIQQQHSIRLKTTDNQLGEFSKAFSVFVKKVNKLPTAISISTDTVNENAALNSAVASFSTTDLDPGDVHSYSFVSGAGDADNGNFLLSNNNLIANSSFNYNAKNEYNIRVESNDGFGGTFQETFKLFIRDNNDNPSDLLLSATEIFENQPNLTAIGNLSTIDRDSNDTHTYEMAFGNNDNQFFEVNGNVLRAKTTFNFEAANSFSIDLRTIDADGLFFTKRVIISVLDTNDTPTAIAILNGDIDEKTMVNSVFTTFSTTDEDVNETFTYALVSGPGNIDNASFLISGSDLVVDSIISFKNKPTLFIRVRSTDSGGAFKESALSIRVNDLPDAPTDLNLSSTSFDENLTTGTRISSILSTDEDQNESYTYALVNGQGDGDNNKFTLTGDQIYTNAAFDFEAKDTYSVRVRTSDKDGLTFEKAVSLSVLNVNEAPTGNLLQLSIQETTAVGSVIGQVVFTDVDANDELTYELVNNADLFSIDNVTGEVKVLNNINFESNKTIEVTAKATDMGGLSAESSVIIEVINIVNSQLPAAKIFSPNFDGMNDTWQVANVESYSNYKLIIFAASGEVVYEVNADYRNDWDGTYKGTSLPEGVYYYFFQNNEESNKLFKGSITLKR